MCLISTGASPMSVPPVSVELVQNRVDDLLKDDEHHHGEHRREIERPERRNEAPEHAQVRVDDVVEERLDPVQPHRVRQPDPGHDDERQDQEDVDADEDVDEALDRRDRVCEQRCVRHRAHQTGVRRGRRGSYAWLKKPPRSMRRARSSALTSTLRGVSRKTLSAIRCMPPSSAYVRPEAKSISRFERSVSVLWRFRMTGTASLNWSAICWASLKLLGITRCTWMSPPRPPPPPLPPTDRSTRVSRPRGSSAKMSSNSSRRLRWSRRTFGRSR